MRATNDQALAQRLLSMRDQGAYSFGRFLKLNLWRYLFQIALHSVLLAILAFLGMWPLFIFLLGLVLGASCAIWAGCLKQANLAVHGQGDQLGARGEDRRSEAANGGIRIARIIDRQLARRIQSS